VVDEFSNTDDDDAGGMDGRLHNGLPQMLRFIAGALNFQLSQLLLTAEITSVAKVSGM
jgi:hypothetical protein